MSVKISLALCISLLIGNTVLASPDKHLNYKLIVLSNRDGFARSVNDQGEIVGSINRQACIWKNLQVSFLTSFNGEKSDGESINRAGDIVGGSWIYTKKTRNAVLWINGKIQRVIPIIAGASFARCINRKREIAGYVFSKNGTMEVFIISNNRFKVLPIKNKLYVDVGCIDDKGDLFINKDNRVFIYNIHNSSCKRLSGLNVSASACNQKKEVVGSMYVKARTPHACLWRNNKLIDLKTLGGQFSLGHSINDAGIVVGESWMSNVKQHHAFIWHENKIYDLNSLLAKNELGVVTDASCINNKGNIVGKYQLNGKTYPCLLIPIFNKNS